MAPRHPDHELCHLLASWELPRRHPIYATVRRLFASKGEMDDFFELAFPGYAPWPELGHLTHPLGTMSVSYMRALEILTDTGAERDDLQAGAYLVSDGDGQRHTRTTASYFAGATPQVRANAVWKAQCFLNQCRGIAVDDLRVAFKNQNWREDAVTSWAAGTIKLGVPAEYVNTVLSENGAYGWVYMDNWPPTEVAKFYHGGASAEYVVYFWERADRFKKLWDANVPFEYAVAMTEGADR